MKCSCFPGGEGQHPLFLFMAVTNDEGIAQGVRVPSYLGVSRNPWKRLQELNGREGFPASNRLAKKGAPYWVLELVMGPFSRGARQLAVEWAAKSRKVACRVLYALEMACRINADLEKGTDAVAVPTGRVAIWARDASELERLLETSKRPRRSA